MEMNNFRPESHVAQQSRRDKLRIQQGSTSVHHLEDFPNHLEQQSSVHPGLNPDLVQVRNVRNANLLYDPTLLSSEMINFSTNSNVLSAQRDAMLHQELGAAQHIRSTPVGDASFANLHRTVASNFNASSRATGDPHGCGNWKSLDSQQNGDWMVNYASGSSTGRGSNQSPMFVGEVLSNNARVSNIATSSTHYMKPKYNGYQDAQSTNLTNPSSEISSQDSQRQYGDIHFTSSPFYQNTLQDVVTTASVGTQRLQVASLVHQNIRETGRGSWADAGNELVLLPIYGNQSNALQFDTSSAFMNRPVENRRQWSGELAFMSRKSDEKMSNVATDSNTQGLSLSLSSDPRHLAQFGEGYESQDLPSRTGAFKEPQDSMTMRPNYMCSIPKPSIISKGCGKSLHDMVGTSTYVQRNTATGPLGPFTGYATILKSSRFLRPAQELLDEFCNFTGSKFAKTCEVLERVSGEVSASPSVDGVNAVDTEVGAKVNDNSGVLSSAYHSSNEFSGDCGVGSSSCESYRPEYQQKRAKLLYLQEEVCRKYKQYHQQMQMVVSSFESVAGLSAATPYVSLALKTVSRNFRCLKNAISDQLKHVKKALGEDLLSPTTGASSSKGDTNLSRLKYMDQSFQKHKSGCGDVGLLEPQQHVWRPQRGLPERSVAILKAWLFEHFLHPYPTDTDKHMLAAQTGLSRNQVSNWFINARVRVWKPMVEEIHMLETKSSAEVNQNSSKNDGKSTAEGTSRPNTDQPMNKFGINAMSDNQLGYSGMGTLIGIGDGLGVEQWNQEKRSRVECQVPATMDRSVIGFVPYQRSGLEIGGLGAVSLTLGLRHGVESAQQHQQQLQQEDQLTGQFGGPMIHDFVG